MDRYYEPRKKKPLLQESKKWVLRFLFLVLFGFTGGVLFLLFFMVPAERWLTDGGAKQGLTDVLMGILTFGWIGFGFIATAVFSRFLISHRQSLLPATGVVAMVLLSAFTVFYFLLDTDLMVAMGNLNEETVKSERLTFGSYPDLQKLEQLEDQDYDGVIALLNPNIPFERVLLNDEKTNGKEVGIEVYSFPMLPWVSENGESLRGIDSLVLENDKRYYIHCYLGKHRVDLVRQRLTKNDASGAGTDGAEPLPDRLERGSVVSFEGERIGLGPYPTDEEWFNEIVRQNVQEIISTLDPKNPEDVPWIKKERKIARENDITFTLMPLNPDSPNPAKVRKIALYARGLDHRVYIHDFTNGNRFDSLNTTLGVGGSKSYGCLEARAGRPRANNLLCYTGRIIVVQCQLRHRSEDTRLSRSVREVRCSGCR